MSSLLFLRDSSFFSIFTNTTKVVSTDYLIFLKQMKDEEPINYIIVSLCRGLADYDANEIVLPGTATGGSDTEGHHNDSAD